MDRKDVKGYGVFYYEGKERRAHRMAWMFEGGTVPAGFELDHLCRKRDCVNPTHLDLVTHRVNTQRAAWHSPFCRNGHMWSENALWEQGGRRRRCRSCQRDRRAARKQVAA